VRGAVVVGHGADSCSCWIVDVMKTATAPEGAAVDWTSS
jgi:hypothetical protein